MPDQLADVLQRHGARAENRHERMTQLAGSPLLPQPGRLGDLAKLPAHLPAIQGSAILTAEDEPMILPCIASPQAFRRLPPAVCPQRRDDLPGSLRTRRDRRVLVSPLARTDRQTATVPASRSTSDHNRARASSVRTPVSKDSTTYAESRKLAAEFSVARSWTAWTSVMALEGRPARPSGTVIRLATLRRTLSRAWAWRIARSTIW